MGVIREGIFSSVRHKVCYGLLQAYNKKYNEIPVLVDIIEYATRLAKTEKDLGDDEFEVIKDTLQDVYKPMKGGSELVKDTIIDFARKQETKALMQEYAPLVSSSQETNASMYKDIQQRMHKITKLDEAIIETRSDSNFLIRDYQRINYTVSLGMPTKFPMLNDMLLNKGFIGGELAVFMAPPKSGKTTLMMNIGIGYVKSGYKVLYVDTENGRLRLTRMAQRVMVHATKEEMYDGTMYRRIEGMKHRFSLGGEGDMRFEYLPATRATVGDIKERVDLLWEDYGWRPDVVIVDYVDNMKPEHDSAFIKKHERIEKIYLEIKAFAQEYEFFITTPSQVNREGQKKNSKEEDFTRTDISGSISKFEHADYVIAFLQSDAEKASKMGRLKGYGMRDAEDSDIVPLRVDLDRALIEELKPDFDYDETAKITNEKPHSATNTAEA